MKKNIIITISSLVILFIFSFFLKGQIGGQIGVQIVNDPTNLAKIKEVLEAGQEQINKIKEQTQILKDAQETLVKVNRKITEVNTIKDAINQQTKLISYFTNDLTDIQTNAVSLDAATTYLRRVDNYRNRVLDNNAYLLQLISDNVFQMSDYDRIKAMQDIVDDNNAILQQAFDEKDEYESLNKHLKRLEELKK